MPFLGESNVRQGFAGAGGYTIDQSIRFNDDDTPYMQRTPSGAGNDNTWTFSCWIKRGSDIGSVNTQEGIIGAGDGGGSPARYDNIGFYNDTIQFFTFNGFGASINTTAVYRDPSAWYHLVLRYDDTQATDTDRVRIYVNGVVQALNSPTFPSQNYGSNFNTTYLQRIGSNTVATNRGADGYQAEINFIDGTALDPTSFGEYNADGVWVPIDYTGSYGTNGFYITGQDSTFLGQDVRTSGDQVNSFQASQYTGATGDYTFSGGRVEADTSNRAIRTVDTFTGDFEFNWRYVNMANFVFGLYEIDEDATFSSTSSVGNMQNMTDSWYVQTSSVAANRDIYYGGAVVVDSTTIANGDVWKMTRESGTIKVYRNGSLVHTFSQTSTNEVRLVIAQGDSAADANQIAWVDNSTLGNNFFSSGLAAADQVTDSPTNNFPTLSPIDKNSAATLSDGNLRYSSSSSTYHGARSTFWIDDTTPKIYWEATYVSGGGSSTDPIGLADYEYLLGQLPVRNGAAVFYTHIKGSTASFANETATPHSNVSYDADTGDVLRFAYDPATKKLWVGNVTNGTYLGGGDPATDSTPTATLTIEHPCSPVVGRFGTLGTTTYDFNFGQTALTGTVPTGFVALNSANLPAPAIKDTTKHVQAVSYTGNGTAIGSGGLSVNQDGNSTFQPDLVWIKNYDTNGNEHDLYDAVRGATKVLFPSTTGAESTQTEGLTAFESDGFKVGNRGEVNTGSDGHVAWMWNAADAFSESSFGSNGLASSGRRNTTAGFSIANWTHRTSANYAIKHGLSTTPEFFFIKSRDSGTNWEFWHKDLVDTGKRIVSDNGAEIAAYWADASDSADGTGSYADIGTGESPVTATLFALQDGDLAGTDSVMGYFWHGIDGYSKFGTYTGNNSADGPFVQLGFEPTILIIRRSGTTGDHWKIFDNKRNTANVSARNSLKINANEDHANAGTRAVDFLSNGFKIRHTDPEANASGGTYIYAAWAHQPFGGDGVAEGTAV